MLHTFVEVNIKQSCFAISVQLYTINMDKTIHILFALFVFWDYRKVSFFQVQYNLAAFFSLTFLYL